MGKFVKRLLFFLCLLYIFDRSFILFRFNEINVFNEISVAKMRQISPIVLDDSPHDILVLGSSHAEFALSPELIQNATGLNCLNLAYGGGSNIGKQIHLLNNYLALHDSTAPGTILFGMDVFTMNRSPIYHDEFQKILFDEPATIKHFANKRVFKSNAQLYARFIPSYLANVRKGKWALPYFADLQTYDLKVFKEYNGYEISKLGWVQGYATLEPYYIRYSKVNFLPDTKAESDLIKLISLCKQNEIELVFFQIPEHAVSLEYGKKYEDFDVYMNQLASDHSLKYYNYNSPEVFPVDTDSLFFDSDHLNANGAILFTKMLLNDIILNDK